MRRDMETLGAIYKQTFKIELKGELGFLTLPGETTQLGKSHVVALHEGCSVHRSLDLMCA